MNHIYFWPLNITFINIYVSHTGKCGILLLGQPYQLLNTHVHSSMPFRIKDHTIEIIEVVSGK